VTRTWNFKFGKPPSVFPFSPPFPLSFLFSPPAQSAGQEPRLWPTASFSPLRRATGVFSLSLFLLPPLFSSPPKRTSRSPGSRSISLTFLSPLFPSFLLWRAEHSESKRGNWFGYFLLLPPVSSSFPLSLFPSFLPG